MKKPLTNWDIENEARALRLMVEKGQLTTKDIAKRLTQMIVYAIEEGKK